MSKVIDWKKYYSSNEAHGIIYDYIRESADDLKKEIKWIKVENKKELYV